MADELKKTNLFRLSRCMALCSAIGACVVPLAVAVIFLFPPVARAFDFAYSTIHAASIAEAPIEYRIAAFVLALVPTGFMVWALLSLRRLFMSYAVGDVFSHGALRMLNHVAVALFASVVTDLATQPPIALLLSWHRGAGHRFLSVGFGSQEVATLFIAGAVLVIARVMAEARRMADENASFV